MAYLGRGLSTYPFYDEIYARTLYYHRCRYVIKEDCITVYDPDENRLISVDTEPEAKDVIDEYWEGVKNAKHWKSVTVPRSGDKA